MSQQQNSPPAQLAIAAINAAILAFEAVDPSNPTTWELAAMSLNNAAGMVGPAGIYLGKNFSLFPRDALECDGKLTVEGNEAGGIPLRDLPGLAQQGEIDLSNLANASPEQVTVAKRIGLFLLFCLKLMLVIGVAGGSWYNTRKLTEKSVFTGEGQAAAVGSGAVAAIAQTVLEAGFDQFASWLNLCPCFIGEDIPALVETTKIVVTGLLGASTWFAVLQILGNVDNQTPYQLFGLFGLAFFAIGAINASGEMVVGRQLTVSCTAAAFPSRFAELFNKLGNKKTGAHLLLNFFAWYSYWDYSEAFALVAKTKPEEQSVLFGSLCIFFQFAGFGAFAIETMLLKSARKRNEPAV